MPLKNGFTNFQAELFVYSYTLKNNFYFEGLQKHKIKSYKISQSLLNAQHIY